MSKSEVLSKYSGVKWCLETINSLANDLGLEKGAYDMNVDEEVFYNIKSGSVKPTGEYVLNYKVPYDNGGITYVRVRKGSLSDMADYILSHCVA